MLLLLKSSTLLERVEAETMRERGSPFSSPSLPSSPSSPGHSDIIRFSDSRVFIGCYGHCTHVCKHGGQVRIT